MEEKQEQSSAIEISHEPLYQPEQESNQEKDQQGVTPQDYLLHLFKPMLIKLEESVQGVAVSQNKLRCELDALMAKLKEVKEASSNDQMAVILEEKSKRLIALKRRLTLVHTLLQNSNERCRRLIVQHKITSSASTPTSSNQV